MTNKMTNAIALNVAIEVLSAEDKYTEVVEKLQKMLVQVEKKNSTERKPTATQKENIGLKDAILCSMEIGKQYTVTDLMKSVAELDGLSNQRVSALVRQLLLDGKVEREEIKRKAYFSIKVEV